MKFFAVIVVVVALLLGCAPQVDLEAEKSRVKEKLDQFVQVMETENVELASQIVAKDDDMVNFGTDVAERWVGWDELKASMENQFGAFENSQVSVSNQVIKVHASGKVAWFSETLDWSLTTGGQTVALEGLRLTGVLEKRNDNWLFVQFHASAPVAGQAAEY